MIHSWFIDDSNVFTLLQIVDCVYMFLVQGNGKWLAKSGLIIFHQRCQDTVLPSTTTPAPQSMAGMQCCVVSLWQFPFYILLSKYTRFRGFHLCVRNFSMKDRLKAPYVTYRTLVVLHYFIEVQSGLKLPVRCCPKYVPLRFFASCSFGFVAARMWSCIVQREIVSWVQNWSYVHKNHCSRLATSAIESKECCHNATGQHVCTL